MLKRFLIAVVLIGSLAAVAWAQDSTKTAPPAQPAQAAPAQTTAPTPAEPAPAQAAPAQPMTAAPTAATPETRIEAVKQSLAASKSALKQYEWVETVALTKDGEEKARQQSRCYRDATGAMKKSPMAADTSKAEKKGGLRGKRAAKKQGAMDATLKAAVQVLHQYMPVDPVKIEAAKGEGNVSVSLPGDDNRVRITIKNYAQPGDEVMLVVDAATNAVKAATVKTSMAAEKGEKSPVAAQVTYGALPDGTLYPATAALDLSAQAIKVDVQNTGYKKQAS